jgi:hypothetical protein
MRWAPTTMWFTPLYTSAEMKEMTGDPILNMKYLATRCAAVDIFP